MKDHFLENCTKVCRVKCYFSFSKICNILADFWRRPTTPVRVLSSTARTGQMLVYISIRACRVPPDPFVYFNDRWWTCLSIVACARLVMLWIELSVREVRCIPSSRQLACTLIMEIFFALPWFSILSLVSTCIASRQMLFWSRLGLRVRYRVVSYNYANLWPIFSYFLNFLPN